MLRAPVSRVVIAIVIVTLWAIETQAIASAAPISGMNGWSLSALSMADFSQQLEAMEAEGVQALRIDAGWTTIEPLPPGPSGAQFNFAGEDANVAALAAHGMTWEPILDYSAPWAAQVPGDWRSPPANDSQFAAYAAAVAGRYGAGGSFWTQYPSLRYEPVQTFEVWNEEDANYFWDTGPDPGAYAQLYAATRTAIHAVDPSAQVIVGGLTNPKLGIDAIDFVKGMFAADPGLEGNVDGFGLHPYASTAAGVVGEVKGFRATLDTLGEAAAPIDVTEFGWETGDSSQEAWRAEMMQEVATALGNSDCGIGELDPYDWLNPAPASGGDWGLAGLMGPRPAGTAWFDGLSAARSSAVIDVCPSTTGAATPPTMAPPPPPVATTTPSTGTPSTTPPPTTTPSSVPTGVKPPPRKPSKRKPSKCTSRKAKSKGTSSRCPRHKPKHNERKSHRRTRYKRSNRSHAQVGKSSHGELRERRR